MNKSSSPPNASSKLIFGALSIVAICVCVVTLVSISIVVSRNKTIATEWRHIENIAHTMAEHTHRVFFGLDLVVSSLQEEITLSNFQTEKEFQDYAGTRNMFVNMRGMILRSQDIDALAFIASDGITINTTRGWKNKFDVSKRSYFLALRDNTNLSLSISNPIKSKATGQEIVIVSRRINGPDNAFWGIIMAVTTASRFEKVLLANQEDVQVALFKTDGSPLVRSIDRNAYLLADPTLWDRFEANLKSKKNFSLYTDQDHLLNNGSILTAETVKNYPYLIVATKKLPKILNEWRFLSVLLSIFSLIVIVSIILFGRYFLNRTRESESRSIELSRALESEKKYSALQQQFVSLVSHEFRTPLTIIDGMAQRIARTKDKTTPDQLVERSGKIRRAVERMIELIELTLYADRIDTGNIEVHIQQCKIRDMLAEICEYHRDISPDHNITTYLDGIPESIDADPKLLEHIFTNLLSNAIKYAPDSPLIEVVGKVDGDMVLISIIDQGIGIPAEDLSRMFERFFRAKTATGIKGTGIGLSVCKNFVEMHGGKIEVASVVGGGSTFTVYLPIEQRNHLNSGLGI